MEERVPPHPSSSPRLLTHPHHHLETYVVQIPKDQIYHVPPPVNALIVERFRNPSPAKTNSRGSCCCCGWVCCTVLAVVVLLLVALGMAVDLFSIFCNARDPIFHLESFRARNVTGGNVFTFGLKVSNPNKYSDVVYKQGGESSLAYRGKEVGSGKFPAFLQDRKSSSDVRIVLHGPGGRSPLEIVAAMSGNRKVGQPKLSFTLRVTVTSRMNAGFLQQRDVELGVTCDYAVDKLSGGTNVLSEECVVGHG
ncbi:hypothetical protein MLD38_001666 [Melastoma candidum]|uniref:Uncharacterized protein n=1 Tax=Melastoma candidum TaxID=119954 RepID=A0ACB9SFJ9_9MYRT|nr:hypothetical protein MLD38_001666 [Melastoma candidum]